MVRGPSKPLPKSMLPDEIEKSLRALGSDGDKVRGALERDFAKYAKQAARDRTASRNVLLFAVARPLLTRGTKLAGDWLLGVDEHGFADRLQQVRDRAERQLDQRDPKARAGCRRHARGAPDRGLSAARSGGTDPLHSRRASGGMADAPALGAGAP